MFKKVDKKNIMIGILVVVTIVVIYSAFVIPYFEEQCFERSKERIIQNILTQISVKGFVEIVVNGNQLFLVPVAINDTRVK